MTAEDAELAAANAVVDAALQRFRDYRKLVYKLAVEAYYDSTKSSYCFEGMNAELIRLHMPRWEANYKGPRGGAHSHGTPQRGSNWQMPEKFNTGDTTDKATLRLENEDRELYTALGLRNLAERIDAAHAAWKQDVLRVLDAKAISYYMTDYMTQVRRELGFPPIRSVYNARMEFGWLGERYDHDAVFDVLERAVQSALREYDANAEMNTRTEHPTAPNSRRLYVPVLHVSH